MYQGPGVSSSSSVAGPTKGVAIFPRDLPTSTLGFVNSQNASTALTPATCRHLELTYQQLSQSHSAPSISTREDVAYNSVSEVKAENGHSYVGGDFHNDSSTNETWASTSQQGIPGYVVSSSSGFIAANSVAASAPDKKQSNRLTGPRKPRVEAALSSEEEERRRVRRERNKQAAAKCRQKRVDLTNQLMSETQVLEAEQARLKDQIHSFQKEKSELEFILETHRAHCGPSAVGNRTVSNMPAVSSVQEGVTDTRSLAVSVTGADSSLSAAADSHFPSGESLAAAAGDTLAANSSPVHVRDTADCDIKRQSAALPSASVLVSRPVSIGGRPTSLPSLLTSRTIAVTSSTAGMNHLLTMGLDSLADGHTGLTPLTGIPSGPVLVVGMPMATSSASTNDGSSVGFL